ncbi:MAG TPA: adenylate/guanylate cyclase domain-containing protein [Flavobacteriales bacterium]|nr:adenylate/guanylate cyclase domain-containing protein [Flavobacteriales bacterium]
MGRSRRAPRVLRAGMMALLLSLVAGGRAQSVKERAWADSVLVELAAHKQDDAHRAADLARRALRVLQSAGDPCQALHLRSLLANYLDRLGAVDSAAALFLDDRFSRIDGCPAPVQKDYYRFLTNVQLSLGEFARVDSVCQLVYGRAHAGVLAGTDLSEVRCNHGIAVASMGRLDEAMDLFRAAYEDARAHASSENLRQSLLNMATINALQGDLQAARTNYEEVLALLRHGGFSDHLVRCYQNLGGIHKSLGELDKAIAYQDSAIALARTSGYLHGEADATRGLAEILRERAPRNEAYDMLQRYLVLHDSILDSDRVKAVAEMREKYETEKKERDNQALRAANLEAALRQEQLRRTRNIYLSAGLFTLLGAVGLWSRLRYVHRSRAAIRKEKEISEGLLHNILPEEVAAELKQKGYADVKEFDVATILFSDFKGFTAMSERLTAAELVAEIDHCFKAFDAIMETYRIEKIKTIGDAYMAAGGLPIPEHGGPVAVVRAALAMQAFMAGYKARRQAEGRLFFEMRVGLHSGPVIAGIVGVKKFAYDIWGDAVNTASRMESSGEPGRVNISRGTYDLVKDEPGLVFTPRGLVEAKGKGTMEMWLVELAAGTEVGTGQ